MFTVVLLCDPEKSNLDPALVEGVRNAWGGGDVLWLSPDEAAEFNILDVPSNRWDVWQSCQSFGVDLLVVPAEGRRKKVLLADMDSTMIRQECIDELAEEVGFGAKVSAITALAMDGKLDFETALRERVGLLRGLSVDVISKVLAERIEVMPGAATLLATMKAQSAYAALVSGGFTHFTRPIARHLGFDEERANRLVAVNDVLTGHVEDPIVGAEAKIQALHEVSAQQGASVEECIAVGDGANDLGMLHLAGMGVALHAKPSVAEQCELRVNFGDLTALLFLQGFSRSEFVDP